MTASTLDHSLLTAALEGLELQRVRIDSQIAAVRAQMGASSAPARKSVAGDAAPKPKRRLSAAGRKAIADAARKRWAALKQEKAQAAAAEAPKTASRKAAAGKGTKASGRKAAGKKRAPRESAKTASKFQPKESATEVSAPVPAEEPVAVQS